MDLKFPIESVTTPGSSLNETPVPVTSLRGDLVRNHFGTPIPETGSLGSGYLYGRTLRLDTLGVHGLWLDTVDEVPDTGRFDVPTPWNPGTPGIGDGVTQVFRPVLHSLPTRIRSSKPPQTEQLKTSTNLRQ